MKLLTIGAKPVLTEAIASLPGVQVVAMERELPARATGDAPNYEVVPYGGGQKLSLSAIRQVRTQIERVRPDVIHAFYPRPLAHAVMARATMSRTTLGSRVPVVSYRGITSLPNRWSPSEWVTYLSPQVAAHACESSAVRDALVAAGVPGEKCHVVYNCLTKPPVPCTRDEARARLGLAPDDWVVMMVANLRPVKGADVLLEAATRCGDIPRFKLVLVGEVRDERVTQLPKRPELAGRVVLAGYRDDAAQLMAAADLFVMPSRAEALSVALLEAMSRGICPVVSDAGGMKEAVRHGVDGLVVPRENPAALAQALHDLATSPDVAARYGASAQERVAETFSPARVAERIAAMYGRLAAAA